MDDVTTVKMNYRFEQWSKTILECQSSGQTVTCWCSENGINIKRYYYWLRKIRKQACDMYYIHRQNNRPIKGIHSLDTRFTREDFYAKLVINYKIHSIEKSRQLQRNLYLAAKKNKQRRFHALYIRCFLYEGLKTI